MAFTLPPLPYPADALEPSIDKMTMEIHHDRHHKAYVDNLNKALEAAPDLQNKSIEDLLRGIKSGAGEHPDGRPQQRRRPRQPLDVLGDHGPEGRRQAERRPAPTPSTRPSATSTRSRRRSRKPRSGQFGSGWAWLVVGGDGKLQVVKHGEPGRPFMDGQTPILGHRRLGARLLPEVPEQAGRLRRRLVERRQLERRRRAVRQGEEVIARRCADAQPDRQPTVGLRHVADRVRRSACGIDIARPPTGYSPALRWSWGASAMRTKWLRDFGLWRRSAARWAARRPAGRT